MEDQVDRLIYLLEELGRQAEERLMTYPMHHSSTVHLVLGKLFNDYVSQLRESSGEGLVSILDEVAIPDDDAGVEAMVSEIALRARQIAAELRYQEWQAAEGDEEGREDWADALIRLAEAGVDTDDLINSTDILMAGRGVDRAWVDRIVKLACAGIDVDDLITNLAYRRPPQGPFHRHPRAPRPPRGPRFPRGERIAISVVGDPRGTRVYRGGDPAGTNDAAAAEKSEEARAWRVDLLSRVEKGEITPEEAVELLKQGE